ncbi:MAG: hypothetical protein U9R23_04675 [Candidatus Cloacimonadota bacterium]|nr:hypothetical protein [Candidatus Cloacimonadota bacterium]
MKNERQKHGLKFENWVKKTFFDIYYTSEWDIPEELNPNKKGGAISIKTAKWKGSVYFGDAIRQFTIKTDFTLIVGFWVKMSGKKNIVKITESIIPKSGWRKFWGDVSKEDLLKLDNCIKDRSKNYRIARLEAQKIKKSLNTKSSIITLNPKIDSKNQRRLQCSIAFKKFFKYIVKKPEPTEDKEFILWGRKIEPPLL